MKKYLAYLFSFVLVILISIFSFNIFLKSYFNETFFSTPNLIGLTLDEVKEIDNINNLHVVVAGNEFSSLPAGVIFSQNPLSDKVVKKDRTIKVWISKGSSDFTMPEVVNKNYIDVLTTLQSEGIKIKYISFVSSNLPYNTVLASNPAAGGPLKKGDSVSLLLSKSGGKTLVEVPDTVGLTLEEAINILKDSSFVIGDISYKSVPGLEKGIVVETDKIGEKTNMGAIINIVVSN